MTASIPMDTGATIPTWSGRRARDALTRVKANGAANNTPCVLCHKRINYRLTYPHPMSCSVQHVKSRKHYPHLTWSPSNWAPAHLQCNVESGSGPSDTANTPDLGPVSQQW